MSYRLRDFSFIPVPLDEELRRLRRNKSESVLSHFARPEDRVAFSDASGVELAEICFLASVADLVRVKGVGPVTAHDFAAAGIRSVQDLAAIAPADLADRLLAASQLLSRSTPKTSQLAVLIERAGSCRPRLALSTAAGAVDITDTLRRLDRSERIGRGRHPVGFLAALATMSVVGLLVWFALTTRLRYEHASASQGPPGLLELIDAYITLVQFFLPSLLALGLVGLASSSWLGSAISWFHRHVFVRWCFRHPVYASFYASIHSGDSVQALRPAYRRLYQAALVGLGLAILGLVTVGPDATITDLKWVLALWSNRL